MLNIFYTETNKKGLIQNIIFEYCSKNLEDVIGYFRKKQQNVPIAKVKSYMKQILNGMANVHERGITHRDLKPENILMNDDEEIKICDFGSAKILDYKCNTPYIVSRYYRAPELILGCSDYTQAIDVWAIGCIFMELLTQRPLFPGKTEGSQLIE